MSGIPGVSEVDDQIEVTVEVPVETESAEPVEPGDTVVVVEDGDDDSDAVDAVVIATELDLVQRVAVLEQRVMTISEDAWMAQWQAEAALDAVDELAVADEQIIAATDEAIVETIEGAEVEENEEGEQEITVDEIEPVSSRVHPLFRSLADWKNR